MKKIITIAITSSMLLAAVLWAGLTSETTSKNPIIGWWINNGEKHNYRELIFFPDDTVALVDLYNRFYHGTYSYFDNIIKISLEKKDDVNILFFNLHKGSFVLTSYSLTKNGLETTNKTETYSLKKDWP